MQRKYLQIISGILAIMAMTVILGSSASAVTYKTLYAFTGGVDGNQPMAGLVSDAAGNLYGTTYYGGTYGAGVVFELTQTPPGTWTEEVLYNFTGGADGGWPQAGLIFDAAGNLYGTASEGGGSGSVCNPRGCGVAFELTPTPAGSWTETVIHSFTGNTDGSNPLTSLVFDSAGNLYGTTWEGGYVNDFCYSGCGVVFELSPTPSGEWTETTLHEFKDGLDGSNSWANLTIDTAGNLYGVAFNAGLHGDGNVFELMPNQDGTWTGKVLYQFNDSDGGSPVAGLTFDSAGNLYGATGYFNPGIVFQVVPRSNGSWTKRTLYEFTGGRDGSSAYGGVTFDSAGNLYGTTCYGGVDGDGVVYRLTRTSKGLQERALGFNGHPGENPWGNVIFDTAGNLYGTTSAGPYGTVYEITP